MKKNIGIYKRIAYCVGSALMKLVPRSVINKALDKNARKYEHMNTGLVSPFVDPYDITCFRVDKTLFQDLIEIEFEGRKYPTPRNYDHWLRVLYGDYMELPPMEKRVHQHTFTAFYKHN
jgi:lipopolysaccharide cholinephosphotransferase